VLDGLIEFFGVFSVLNTTTRTAVASSMVWKSTPTASTPKLGSWKRSVDRKLPSSSSSAYLAGGKPLAEGTRAGAGSNVALWMTS
jgi:hypothetical protein